ncbi:unnamed protein product [Trifolium pratense]|uniref:Uncharacterized protein n=1 Tax=Trifolium pratense TaxID=57577 RepID=A0ACB0J5A9_TRIPR|nr:unnamed protein product [Trifolium pratense]
MESRSGNGTSTNLKTSSSTNSSESEPFNSKKKQELSQDHNHLMPNATATTTTTTTTTATPHNESATFLPTNDQKTSSVIEKRDQNSINSLLEANHANPFGDFHPTYPNTSNPSSLSSSSSQNPFLLLNDDDTMNIRHVNANESKKLHDQVPFEPRLHQPSTYESTQGNPFQVPPTTSTINDFKEDSNVHPKSGNDFHLVAESSNDNASRSANKDSNVNLKSEKDFHLAAESSKDNASSNTNEDSNVHPKSGKDFHLAAESSHDNASSNTEKDTNVHPKSGKDFHLAAESSHDNASSKTEKDINVHPKSGNDFHLAAESSHDNASSKTEKDTNVHPKSEKDFHVTVESSDDGFPISSMPKHGQQSTNAVVVPETIQNPPIQVMERQEDPPATSSTNRIPLHVFDRDQSNTKYWSATSNESLFSIQMGNMSFSNDMAWSSNLDVVDKQADHTNNASGGSQSNHPPPLPPPQSTKFNDISNSFAEQHEDSLKATEAKAAETMREVIMETSTIPKNNKSNGDLKFDNSAPHSNILLSSYSDNDHSQDPDGSTKSFAFKASTDRDKNPSSRRGEDMRKQQKQSTEQNVKGTSGAPQNPKSTPNASENKWLSCFACCH